MKNATVLGLVLIFSISGCGRDPMIELENLPTDEFSGKTVVDGGHAQKLVMARLGNAPTVGQKAPEGALIDAKSGRTVRLSSLWKEKPIVLIFGSGSCSSVNFLSHNIDRLSNRFNSQVNFFFVYIREAHPEGGFKLPLEGILADQAIAPVTDPVGIDQRRKAALQFQKLGGPKIVTLVDPLNDSTAIQWSAWPSRIFVIAPDGTVIYAADQGPWYFDVSKEGWKHDPPPAYVEETLSIRSFDRISLEEFLEVRFGTKARK